ncbi:hypothetical protein DBV15_10189 [Temnothorax longispinosus]|uniref:Uncharacterized protein n=1 Tax=Temnothorax longispinosus TaxID=300112 RepID=A0A4S2KVZ3_9HYME|nr:hypothetical protein DBV15_10189 [Temnothorax longispinosus]
MRSSRDFTIANEASSFERTRKQLEARDSFNPFSVDRCKHGKEKRPGYFGDEAAPGKTSSAGGWKKILIEEQGRNMPREELRKRQRATCLEQGRERPRGCVRAAQSPESIATTHSILGEFSHREVEGYSFGKYLFMWPTLANLKDQSCILRDWLIVFITTQVGSKFSREC